MWTECTREVANEPAELEPATLGLEVVPAEAAAPGGDVQLVEEREVGVDLIEALTLVVVLENRE
jgi:hypothetical protein